MLRAADRLDAYYNAPLEWPEAERTQRIERLFLKVAALGKGSLVPQASLPFDSVESRFLVGLSFRFTLRDLVYSSQRRHDRGVLVHPVARWRRAPLYREILELSYHDYFERLAIPYYRDHGLAAATADALAESGDLRTYEAALRANPDVRIIANRNDFLLDDSDLAWLGATFGPDRLTLSERGGHLGNLANPRVQKAILDALGPVAAARP
jgi:hypothetical protein